MAHLTLTTCKTPIANLADVRCFVDGYVVDVVGNWCVRWKSSTDYDVVQAAVTAIRNDRWLSENLSAPLTRMEDRLEGVQFVFDVG